MQISKQRIYGACMLIALVVLQSFSLPATAVEGHIEDSRITLSEKMTKKSNLAVGSGTTRLER